jgi:hypothetical protein
MPYSHRAGVQLQHSIGTQNVCGTHSIPELDIVSSTYRIILHCTKSTWSCFEHTFAKTSEGHHQLQGWLNRQL